MGRGIPTFVAGVGTGGTLMGVARYLEQDVIRAEIVGVEPSESAAMSSGKAGHHGIEDIGDGSIPPLMGMSVVTRVEAVSAQGSVDLTLRLMREEGIMGGISTGADVAAAIGVARDLGPGRKVMTLAPTRAPGTSPPRCSESH